MGSAHHGPTSQPMTAEMALELMPPEQNSQLPTCTVGGQQEQGSLVGEAGPHTERCSGVAPASTEHGGWHQGRRRGDPITPWLGAGKSTTTQGRALQVSTKGDRVTAGLGVVEDIERQLLSTDFPPTLLS